MKLVSAFRKIGPDVTVTFPPFPPFDGGLKTGLTVMMGLNVLVLVGLFVMVLVLLLLLGQQHGF
jgi:hypothetical protein